MEFLQDAFVYLLAAVVAVPLAKRLGLGSVLGYLIAGIVIGPLLGIVGSESEDVQHFAEFGVVMMLFLVGLELRPSVLWRMRNRLVGLGGLQMICTIGLLAAAGWALGLAWNQAVAMGMILSLSSTAVVLQSLEEKKLRKSEGGQATFSVLLFQDIAVIPMLAFLPLLAVDGVVAVETTGATEPGGHGNALADLPGWVQTLAIFGVISTIIVGGRFLIRPIFRFIATARLREIFTAAALLLVVGIAVAMDQVGLSPALGTFLAGVVLSDSEYRHELESDIDPFKGLLLGLFFISVGASINFSLLTNTPFLVFGLAVGLMTIKFVVLFGLAKVFRLPRSDGWLFALGPAQAGEFAFVLFSFASGVGVLGGEETRLATLVVAVTLLLTPLLFILYERVLAPRMIKTDAREADVIDETGTVILAGVGRFGQIVARLLVSNGHKVVVLDHDPKLTELLRRVGLKTYYGDATRPDLLIASGIDEAKLFVAALNDREQQTELVRHVASHYGHIRIIARALDRHHVYELEKAGAQIIEREVFEGSLSVGRRALIELGLHPFQAERKMQAFRAHDLKVLEHLRETFHQDGISKAYREAARAYNEELFDLMKADQASHHDLSESGWTPPKPNTTS